MSFIEVTLEDVWIARLHYSRMLLQVVVQSSMETIQADQGKDKNWSKILFQLQVALITESHNWNKNPVKQGFT